MVYLCWTYRRKVMGTNVYMKRIPTESELNEIKARIDNRRFDDAIEFINQVRKEVHIGKRSGGWQFLFAPNPDYYEENWDSINNFLHEPGWELINEYGDHLTPAEFKEEYVNDFADGYDSESYHEAYPEEPHYPGWEHKSTDGLRFASHADFA